MNLRGVKIFNKVCETKNMSQAADELYMTQPAVSQAITRLENEFQVKLFERMNQNLNLTYAGEVFCDYSRRILLLVNEAENSLEDLANMKQGKLRIGASMTIGTYLVPSILNKFEQDYPNIELNFIIDNTKEIENQILSNKIDIGLVEGPISSSRIEVSPFFNDNLSLVCGADHPWNEKENISPAQLKNANFIMREKGSGTRKIIENILADNEIDYTVTHVLNNIEAIKKALQSNLGVTVLPQIAVQDELEAGKLNLVNLSEVNFKRKFKFIYHLQKYKSKLFNEFINYLQQHSNQ